MGSEQSDGSREIRSDTNEKDNPYLRTKECYQERGSDILTELEG